ncbi:MAG: nitrite reductase small subunit NirD [Acidobacteriaceae bacterium]
MSKTKWIALANADSIPLREGRSVNLDGHEIAIFNLGDRFLAVENRCPHRGGPLSEGILSGDTVVCPLHSWKVCLQTGAVTKPETDACVATYKMRVEAGVVLLEVPEQKFQQQQNRMDPTASSTISLAADKMALELEAAGG